MYQKIKQLAELYPDNEIFSELVGLYANLENIKKERAVIIALFAVISSIALLSPVTWTNSKASFMIVICIVVHDLFFIRAFHNNIKDEESLITKIRSIQSKILETVKK